jgi:putative selenate reductase
MNTLSPQPFEVLLGRALAEHEAQRAVFGLPRRSFWRGAEGLDLSIAHPGGAAATPLGIAAGPHTQLAHNIVVGWLAGARVIELKTVQVLDRLEIPRPCIDAPDIGTNVEWSQELPIERSAEQYAAAWAIIHILDALGIPGLPGPIATRFDASVGYDLAGIRSDKVARFLDTMGDAGPLLADFRRRLSPALRAAAAVEVPARIVDQVTLSTFHGCPPEEIEAMVEHLFTRHRLHVVVKFNPTLLGFAAVDELLHARMGYRDLVLDRAAFEQDLQWAPALAMFGRLARVAAREGLSLGAKFTNTLVVKNTRGHLSGEVVYLSGPPLHPIAVALAARFAEATGGVHPIAFSGGIDAENFADAVACGLRPVTTCTDLLKPTGYRRLPRYLKALVAAMEGAGARDVAGLAAAVAGPGESGGAALPRSLNAYAARAAADPRYAAAARAPAATQPTGLALFDCASCNNCTLVCPNGAFFSLALGPLALETWDLMVEGGEIRSRPARFALERETQWVLADGLCNACGNCDTFCPERGGPFRIKPRLFDSHAAFEAAAPADGILIEDDGRCLRARFGGEAYRLERDGGSWRFSDSAIEVTLDPEHRIVATSLQGPHEGHTLPLSRYHALRLLGDAVRHAIHPLTGIVTPVPPERHAPASVTGPTGFTSNTQGKE